jgi:hypothetical protein
MAGAAGAVSNTESMLLSVSTGTEGNQTGLGEPIRRTLQAFRAFCNGLPCRVWVNGALGQLSGAALNVIVRRDHI